MFSHKPVKLSLFSLASSTVLALALIGCGSKPAEAADDPASSEPEITDEGSSKGQDETSSESSAATKDLPTSAGEATPKGDQATPKTNQPAPKTDPGAQTGTGDLVAKLSATLKGVLFVSEGDFPWTVLEGDGAGVTDITSQLVAERLGGAIAKLNGGEGRNLGTLQVEQDEDGFEAFLDDLASDPQDPAAAKYIEAKTLLKGSLQGVKVFFFDINGSGDQGTGPIITVIVGRSATNKLVAMVTFQVAT
jgi:hypothetical protein